MDRLESWGPWPATIVALLALAGFALGAASEARGDPHDLYEVGLAVVLAPVAVWVVFVVQPSVTLTIGLVLSVYSGHWDTLGAPIAVDRLFIAAAALAILIRARKDPAYRIRLRIVHAVVVLAALYAVGSALWVGALDENYAFFALLDRFGLIPFALFVIAPVAYRTREQRDHLLIGLVAVGAYLGVTALAEGLGLDDLVFPRYILDPFVGLHHDRVRGPFVEAAANGLALFACAVAAAMAAARWSGHARALAIGVGVVCLLGVLLTVTRQAWLGAVLGGLVGVSATRQLRPYALPLVVGGVALVIGAFAVVPGLQEQADRRSNDQKPVWDRLNSDRAALDMIAARPLFGFGWGQFFEASEPYYTLARDYPLSRVRDLHSVALSNAVELGLVGFTLWAAALLLAMAGALLRRGPPDLEPWRLGLLAVVVCWLVVSNFTPLGYTFSNNLLWLWAGVCGAAALSGAPREETRAI